jgi:predicted Rossmann-fold nucleotide-binding protein
MRRATYVCAACGKEFAPAWSEAEAEAELARHFPGIAKEQCARVCNDCYPGVMRRVHRERHRRRQQSLATIERTQAELRRRRRDPC